MAIPYEALQIPEVELWQFCHDGGASMNRKLGVCWQNRGMMMFYDVSEVRTCSGWAIYSNQICFVLTGDACPDCCTSSTKPNPGDHVDLSVSLTSPSPATLTTIISVQGDPTLISEQDGRPQVTWSCAHCKRSRQCLSVSGVTWNGRLAFKPKRWSRCEWFVWKP